MRISHSGRIGNHHPPIRNFTFRQNRQPPSSRPHHPPPSRRGVRRTPAPPENANSGRIGNSPLFLRPSASSMQNREFRQNRQPPPRTISNSGRIGNSPLLPTILAVAPA